MLSLISSHPRWPFPFPVSRPLRISVLDSSFNPPTLAHLALANAARPGTDGDYDARLLLLSIRNVDKVLKPGDASYSQRLDMMCLMSKHISNTPDNVAVAVTDEPTFVGKSTKLLSFLKHRFEDITGVEETHRPPVQLTFILGMDTLERFFAPRYYGTADEMQLALRKFFSSPPEGEDSSIICAHRTCENPGVSLDSCAQEFIDSGRVVMIDIGTKESTYSSTAVRHSIQSGDSNWRSYVTDSIAQYIIENGLY